MAGLYIHIPFCASRCIYCGFYSTVRNDLQHSYIDALCTEMDLRMDEAHTIDTIYLGGGTPSMLSAQHLDRLMEHIYKRYRVSHRAEVTIECNPDDVCRNDFWLPSQINRVSMGAQTFANHRLAWLHRRHTAAEVDDAVAWLRQHNIQNVSIDLMFGFPGETLADWQSDIRHALSLQVEHLSAYSLMYEEGTHLYHLLEQGKVKEISDDLSLKMYDTLVDTLTAHGYEHYEISNFARLGHRSRHNSSYWTDTPYIGLGAAAHSYNGTTRSWNCAHLEQYIEAIGRGELPSEHEDIDARTHYNDLVTTALRTSDGLNIEALNSDQQHFLLTTALPYIDRGLLALDGHRLHLTRQGIYLSDSIMADLMQV